MQDILQNVIFLTKISLQTGEAMLFTSHDKPITCNNLTYQTGLDQTKIASTTISINAKQNSSITILQNSKEALDFDGASVEFMYATLSTLPKTTVIVKGYVINAEQDGFAAKTTLTIVPLAYCLYKGIGTVFSPVCRANLGDSDCAKNLDWAKESGVISQIINDRSFNGTHNPRSGGYFDNGTIVFTSGKNNGYTTNVVSDEYGTTTLLLSPPYPFAIEDNYTMCIGCDKTLQTCHDTFQNVINFRGEPFINASDSSTSSSS